MKEKFKRIYDIIALKREVRQLKKQIKEQQRQIDTMILNAKEREKNLKFANDRANKFLTELRKLKKNECERKKEIKKNNR